MRIFIKISTFLGCFISFKWCGMSIFFLLLILFYTRFLYMFFLSFKCCLLPSKNNSGLFCRNWTFNILLFFLRGGFKYSICEGKTSALCPPAIGIPPKHPIFFIIFVLSNIFKYKNISYSIFISSEGGRT